MISAYINSNKEDLSEFPKLMIANNGMIILAEGINDGNLVGVCLKAPKKDELRYYCYTTDWTLDEFKDFKGKLTLENS